MSVPLTLGTLSFLLAVIWGGPFIRFLREHRIGKQIRVEEPTGHKTKTGTPTMGGLLFLVPVLLITIILNIYNLLPGNLNLIGRSILAPLFTMVSFGALGAVDDFVGVRRTGPNVGLLGRHKMLVEVILAFVLALALYLPAPLGQNLHSVALPRIPEKIDIGLLYIPVAMFIIIGAANGINLTDGLDGLAGWTTAICFAAYGVIAFLQEQIYLVNFCFLMVGALLAFLWYNAHPAELFMGDAGALALGATLGVVALMTGQWLLLPLIGVIFVAETLSVVLQVLSAKYSRWRTGKDRRLFKMAPLHLHFELLGWSETQVVQRFWLIGMLAGMLGVALALL